MPFASPADLSPIPEAEAPRDCPLCPRLVAFRQECRAEHPDWWNAPVPAFGDREAWLAFGHGSEIAAPDGRILLSSYHCSRYNQNTGRLDAAMFESVFERALALKCPR